MSVLIRKPIDFIVTSLLWVYFIAGFALMFVPYISWSKIRGKTGQLEYQAFFHVFFRVFFRLTRLLSPGLTISIDPGLKAVQSSIIIGNHLSYLDPLLMVATFPRHKTIVKSSFFQVPVFGWFLRQAGYIPSSANGKHMALVVKHVGEMADYLATGGNLFIFPEGTRSRTGHLNAFREGAFNIARQCQAPIAIVQFRNTEQLFKPDTGLFNTCQKIRIDIKLIDTITPDRPEFDSSEALSRTARQILEREGAKDNQDLR